jgi:hypothetical protein
MRYELTDREWAIRPMLANKPRGVPRVNDRRVLNGCALVSPCPNQIRRMGRIHELALTSRTKAIVSLAAK